jgi:hypothetical protein
MTITEQAENDSDLEPLRGLPRFRELMDKLRSQEEGAPETDTAS